jgi:phenylalanyl-tRNA synthetase beta chain
MKVSYKWLSEYVDLSGVTPEELAEKLTRGGIEVDSVEHQDQGLDQVVAGLVLACEKHPDAEKLNVCKVNAGTGEELQIVCGAKNVGAGQKVPVALVGATLPGGIKIKRAKLRGVESQGMICSSKELGLKEKLLPKHEQEGILVLHDDVTVGTDIRQVLGLDDAVLELDLTPNRSDALSMIGVAYEIATLLDREVKLPAAEVQESSSIDAAQQVKVRIDAPDHCYRYAARLVVDVEIKESPLWMKNRLMAAGIRPINNIVDITNYVMLEYGQPLHAFDLEQVEGDVIVRTAYEGEKIISLDDQERTLDAQMLLIADEKKAIGIAGVMGGANSEVSPSTRKILIESARFVGSSIRKTAKELGLRSEASLRFEKEVNPLAVIPALNRAAQLMAELAGGTVAQGIVDEVARKEEETTVPLRLQRVNSILGTALTLGEVEKVMERLSFNYVVEGEQLQVHVPRRRGDITREIDLVEEVARLYGYDQIPTSLMVGETTPGSLTAEQRIRRSLRELLTSSGFYEAVTYSFTDEKRRLQYPGLFPKANPVKLAMPMSEERSELRTSLIPHLIEVAEYNRNRKNEDVAVFEIGKVFLTDEEQLTNLPEEKWILAGLITGHREATHWTGKRAPVDFYDAKGMIEKISEFIGVEMEYRSAQTDGLHPGRTADILLDGKRIGTIGQLHPEVQVLFDLEPTFIFEFELADLITKAEGITKYQPLPRYPAITRDIAIVLDHTVAWGEIEQEVRESAGKLLESLNVFDVFTGERIGANRKSVAFSLVYRHPDKTLTDEEVTEVHHRVVAKLEQAFKAELRK